MRILLLSLYFTFTACCYAQHQKYPSKVILAVETYSFLLGQKAALKKVALEFPRLKDDVAAAENSSKVIFGRAEKNIEHFLKDELGVLEFNKIKQHIGSLALEQLKHPVQKEEYAREFIKQAAFKLKLSESGDIQKGIISFAFHDAPHQEVIDGHTTTFSTKDHLKADHTALVLPIPKSWRAAEAEMPATVQQFTSYAGNGSEKILVVIHDLASEDAPLVLDQKSVAGMIPPQSTLMRTESVAIDGTPGIMIETEEVLFLSNQKQKIRMLQFMFTYKQKLYCLQGSIGPVSLSQNLDPHIKKYEPLFRLIASRTQLMD